MLRKSCEMNEKERLISTALLALIGITLSFIFIQSLLPPAVSKGESDAVASILAYIFPSDGFVLKNLRQIAHFLEFGALGAEVGVYILLFSAQPLKLVALSPVFGLITAFIDETIQIFSGRSADVVDIWTDLMGFCCFVALSCAIYTATVWLLERRKK